MRATAPRRLPAAARRLEAGALCTHQRVVSRALVERAHGAGIAVLAWTVNSRPDLERVVAAGVDGVVSDDPGLLLPQ
jgi:glycerophosphoryl diester phosphodiesterase